MFQDLSNKRRHSGGYSLIELMMAMLVFGVMVIALSFPISNSMYLTHDNKSVSNANNLARTYLRDMQDAWKLQNDYDNGNLITIGSDYTDNGKYNVTVSSSALETDDDGNTTLRRINITYEDTNNNSLCDVYYDFNRP